MNRRLFLCRVSAALALAAPISRSARAAGAPGWRTFELRTQIDVEAPDGPTQVWIPLPLAAPTDYQRRIDLHWDAGGAHARAIRIPGYDVELLHVAWPDAKSVGRVILTSRVATRDRAQALPSGGDRVAAMTPAALQQFLKPTALLPTDGIVRATAQRITRDREGDVDKARALYDWVVDNTTRDPATRGCGVGDVGSMLETGFLGGKCADINALFVALARSVGIPARDAYGLRVADSRLGYRSLGKSGDVSRAQHCRAEFHARGHGWIPVDPADVRKVMLEEPPGNLPMTDAKVQAARARLFGSWEMNWIAYNHGHDVVLPGAGGKPLPFLMYPQGESGARRLDSLDPAAFRYRIEAREIGA